MGGHDGLNVVDDTTEIIGRQGVTCKTKVT